MCFQQIEEATQACRVSPVSVILRVAWADGRLDLRQKKKKKPAVDYQETPVLTAGHKGVPQREWACKSQPSVYK